MANNYSQIEIAVDIYSIIGIEKEAKLLIVKTLSDIWPQSYLEELDIVEYINTVTDLWIKNYVNSSVTIEAIEKLKSSDPPEDLDIRLIFYLFDEENNLILEFKEQLPPVFTVLLPTTASDAWNSYVYNSESKKFESLEMIQPESIEEIKATMSLQEKLNFEELIIQTYTFHEKLLK